MMISKNHKKLVEILNEIGLMVETEVQVEPYSLDCYEYDCHIGFEADSKVTHMKGRDRKRDNFIMQKYNIPILRIYDTEMKNKEEVTQKILGFIEHWYESAEVRRGGFMPRTKGVL